jgi:hypothetical protein
MSLFSFHVKELEAQPRRRSATLVSSLIVASFDGE